MEKNLLSVFLSLCFSITIAQPTLTSVGINPVVGDVFALKSGPGFNPGNAGANQTWGVNPVLTGTPASYSVLATPGTPYNASFAQANMSSNTGAIYNYYNASSTALQYYGHFFSHIMSYSDPEDVMHFPFNMGDTYSDSWSTTFTTFDTFVRTGTTTVTYDGYGSLSTPAGTFNNAVRVHVVQIYYDSYSQGPISYYNDQYVWYVNNNHHPVAMTYTLLNSFNGSSSTSGSVIMTNAGPTSISEHTSIMESVSVFPNPAANLITIEFNHVPVSLIEISDINGKKIYVKALSKDLEENNIILNTNGFANGIYFVKFTGKDGHTGTKKICILK